MSGSGAGPFKGVAEPCAAYKKLSAKWDMILALLGGTEAMRKAGETYLPRSPKEGDRAYQVRRDQSFLFNGYKRILGSLSGKPFRRAIALGADMPRELRPMMENVDLRGAQVNVFAGDLFYSLMKLGSVHIFVDFPNNEPAATRAEELAVAARPYWLMIEANDLIGWRHEYVNGKPKLVEARIRERVVETSPEGGFEEKEIEQIRVLLPGQYFLFRKIDGGEWDAYDQGEYTLDEIPLVTIRARGGSDLMTAEPPLMPVAELNVAHWQSQSDQRNILHVVRCPILVATGMDDDGDLEIGPSSVVVTRDPQAQIRYVEHGGAAIAAGQKDLDGLEEKMAAMGMELLRQPAPLTATQATIDNAGSEAELVTLAHLLQDGIENALALTALWMGLDRHKAGSVSVYKDFVSESSRVTDIASLTQIRQMGDITRGTLLNEMKRRGVFEDNFDPEHEQAALLDESIAQSQLDQVLNPPPPDPYAVDPNAPDPNAPDPNAPDPNAPDPALVDANAPKPALAA